jgi:SNF2 family DNA or RNA helicase
MGLGKTIQALAVLVARAAAGPALVIAPLSVGFNWLREAAKFAPALRALALSPNLDVKTLAAGDLVIASYGQVVRDERLQSCVFATLVLDEAQAIKNPATQRAKAVRAIAAEFRFALTGTPIENHIGELWSLLRVVTPGLLGSWEQFRTRFAVPIERDGDERRRRALSALVRPFILRRTKSQVMRELPPRTDILVPVTLSEGERTLYDSARLAAVSSLAKVSNNDKGDARFEILAAITRLRLLACHPRLYDPASVLPSSKLEAFLRCVDGLRENGHRALVFSQFTRHLAVVKEALDARAIPLLVLDGSTPAPERARRVDAFQSGTADLFLISLKAGGFGLNLTGADYVIHLDPWWNPAVEEQAIGRAHRMGQERPVTVYRFVCTGTIEETILSLHADKRELVTAVLDGTDGGVRLSAAELLALIPAGG